jgi:ribosomal-protein-alanine N-acetyltransferase
VGVPPARRRAASAIEVGPRVFLRAPVPGDAPALAALARSSRLLHRPWIYPPATPAALARWVGRARRPERRTFLVCRRDDGAIVGVINVSEIVRGALQSAYLGYYAFHPHAGQGYMREGLGLVLRHAFRRLGLHRVEANIQPENRASRALARRHGFRREGFSARYLKVGGRWRDHERWALVREWWRPDRPGGPGASGGRPAVRGVATRAGQPR